MQGQTYLRNAGVAEICASAYALGDAGLAAIGACTLRDIALHAAFGDLATALGEYPYPWQTRADSHPVGYGTAPGPLVAPARVCSLLPHLGCVTVCDAADGRPAGQWKVLYERDAPPGRRHRAAVS